MASIKRQCTLSFCRVKGDAIARLWLPQNLNSECLLFRRKLQIKTIEESNSQLSAAVLFPGDPLNERPISGRLDERKLMNRYHSYLWCPPHLTTLHLALLKLQVLIILRHLPQLPRPTPYESSRLLLFAIGLSISQMLRIFFFMVTYMKRSTCTCHLDFILRGMERKGAVQDWT